MTTYFSFAEDSATVSPGGSTTGVEDSKEADDMFLGTPPPLLSSDSSTLWDGLDHEVDVALPAGESPSFDAVKCTGVHGQELGVLPDAFISGLAITVADDDEESLASNSPSVGAASVLTLDTALQSLKGLALIEDDTFVLESSLRLPPPPPPPGLPPRTALQRKLCACSNNSEGEKSASNSISPKTIEFEEDSEAFSPSADCVVKGESENIGEVKEEAVVDITAVRHQIDLSGAPMITGEERGAVAEAATKFYRDQASMTNEMEFEEKGSMTEDVPVGQVERKVASLYSCIRQLFIIIDRLAMETGGKGSGRNGIESLVEILDIDPLSPPPLEDLSVHIDELNRIASSNVNLWDTRLQRASLQNQSFQKEQRRWRRENGSLRDEIRYLKMQAAESVSHNKKSADALKEENDRLRSELERMREEARGAFPTDKMSAIALATSVHRGPKTRRQLSVRNIYS